MKTPFQRVGGILTGTIGIGFASAWIALWSVGTLTGDFGLAASLYYQLRAIGFRMADGVIVSSKLEQHSDSEGTSYTPAVEYRYSVGRQEHVGRRINYSWVATSSQGARQAIAQYPAGQRVTVYYDPRRPEDSLLEPGLHSGQAFLALFLLPFNIIMATCWLAVWQWFRGTAGRLPEGARATATPEGFVLRLYRYSPLAAAALAALFVSFAGVFIAAFGSGAMPQSFLVGCAWVVVSAGSTWAYRRQYQRAVLLTVDELRGHYRLQPAAAGRAERAGPLQELSGVTVREHQKLDSDGDLTKKYSVALVRRSKSGAGRHCCLVTGWSEQPARQLADWLTERLKLPAVPSRA